MQQISPEQLQALKRDSSCYILDVRAADEVQACYLPGSINVELGKIEQGQLPELPRDRPIYLLCQSGVRSERARQILQNAGYSNLVCVAGGIKACKHVAGLLVVRSKVLPIMRQVQIVAGLLVSMGVVFAQLMHPAWLGLSLFVGLGLVFAGISGYCGMALLLAKMPWNRLGDGETSKNCG